MQRRVNLAFHLPFPGSLYTGWPCVTGMGVGRPHQEGLLGVCSNGFDFVFNWRQALREKTQSQAQALCLPLPPSLDFLCGGGASTPPPVLSHPLLHGSEKTHLASRIYKVALQCHCSFRTLLLPFTIPTLANHTALLSKRQALEKSLPWRS